MAIVTSVAVSSSSSSPLSADFIAEAVVRTSGSAVKSLRFYSCVQRSYFIAVCPDFFRFLLDDSFERTGGLGQYSLLACIYLDLSASFGHYPFELGPPHGSFFVHPVLFQPLVQYSYPRGLSLAANIG